MNLIELDRALRQLRLGGMATVLESRLAQAQSERMAPIDLISVLVSDELRRRADRLLDRRTKHAHFRDGERTLDNFDFDFNKKMNRRLISTSSRPATSSQNTKTSSSSAHRAPARVTSPRRSVAAPFSKVIESLTVRHTCSSSSSRTPRSTVPANRS